MLVAAVLVVLLILPVVDRGKVGNGMVFFLAIPVEAVALFGFGGALARIGRVSTVLAWLLFLAGVAGGCWAEGPVLRALVQRPGGFELTGFVGPFLCFLAGSVLMLGDGPRRVAAPVAAPFAGVAAGFVVVLHDPTLGDGRYYTGVAITLVWLMSASAVLLRFLPAGAAMIASRVAASWLLAIGLLLGAAVAVSVLG